MVDTRGMLLAAHSCNASPTEVQLVHDILEAPTRKIESIKLRMNARRDAIDVGGI